MAAWRPKGGAAQLTLLQQVQAMGLPVLFDPTQLATRMQETTGASATTPANIGDPCGSLKNLGTLGGWAVASSNAKRPIVTQSGASVGLLFDGVDDVLRLTFTSIAQPFVRLLAFQLVSWSSTGYIVGGGPSNFGIMFETGSMASPTIATSFGSSLGSPAIVAGANYITTEIINGSSSSLQVNNAAPVTGNAGANAFSGEAIACRASNGGNNGNVLYLGEPAGPRSLLTDANIAIAKSWLNQNAKAF